MAKGLQELLRSGGRPRPVAKGPDVCSKGQLHVPISGPRARYCASSATTLSSRRSFLWSRSGSLGSPMVSMSISQPSSFWQGSIWFSSISPFSPGSFSKLTIPSHVPVAKAWSPGRPELRGDVVGWTLHPPVKRRCRLASGLPLPTKPPWTRVCQRCLVLAGGGALRLALSSRQVFLDGLADFVWTRSGPWVGFYICVTVPLLVLVGFPGRRVLDLVLIFWCCLSFWGVVAVPREGPNDIG